MAVSADTSRVPLLVVGTAIWLSSELMFFGALLGAFYALRARADGAFVPSGVELDVMLAGTFTVLLVASSATAELGVRRLHADDRVGYRRFTLATAALGSLFLVAQAVEWLNLEFSVSDHAFGSTFFLLTGFHGLHVTAGILALMLMAGRAGVPGFGRHQLPGAEVVSLYWHMVDVVWLAVFASLYLVA